MLCGLPGAGKSSTPSATSTTSTTVYTTVIRSSTRSPGTEATGSYIWVRCLGSSQELTPFHTYAHKPILDFLSSLKNITILAEGKRVTSTTLLTKIEALGYRIRVVHLACSETRATDRVVARDSKPFKPPFAKQCLGAVRKVV